MLSRRTAAEVLARQQHLRATIARLIEHELWIQRALRVVHARLAVIEIAPFVEQVRTVTRALNRLQKLLRDDRVGIDVGTIEWCHQTFARNKLFHVSASCSV